METKEEMFIRDARQGADLLKENDIAVILLPKEGFTLSEKKEIELALNDCKFEWDACVVITKRKIGSDNSV
jgi:hypothetical protein